MSKLQPAVRTDRLGPADARLTYGRFGFGDLEDTGKSGLPFDAFNYVDHAFQRRFRQSSEEAGVLQHRFLHERIARTDRYAMSAGNAA